MDSSRTPETPDGPRTLPWSDTTQALPPQTPDAPRPEMIKRKSRINSFFGLDKLAKRSASVKSESGSRRKPSPTRPDEPVLPRPVNSHGVYIKQLSPQQTHSSSFIPLIPSKPLLSLNTHTHANSSPHILQHTYAGSPLASQHAGPLNNLNIHTRSAVPSLPPLNASHARSSSNVLADSPRARQDSHAFGRQERAYTRQDPAYPKPDFMRHDNSARSDQAYGKQEGSQPLPQHIPPPSLITSPLLPLQSQPSLKPPSNQAYYTRPVSSGQDTANTSITSGSSSGFLTIGSRGLQDSDVSDFYDIDGSAYHPRFEYAFTSHPETILSSMLAYMSFQDVVALSLVSKKMLTLIRVDALELLLLRFIGPYGYRTRTDKGESDISLVFEDLVGFTLSHKCEASLYQQFAKRHRAKTLRLSDARRARATTRAYSRVVMHIRTQDPAATRAPFRLGPRLFHNNAAVPYRAERAPIFRVWIPTRRESNWMEDAEVLECEKEITRCGLYPLLRRGDIVHNISMGNRGNDGKLLFDGKFLRDLQYTYEAMGHLPQWLDMFSFSPSYFHNVIMSSSIDPVFFINLSPFVSRIQETMHLQEDMVQMKRYDVKTFVYRGFCEIQRSTAVTLGISTDWVGYVYVETFGTAEHAAALIAQCAKKEPTPWKVLRAKSSPGSMTLRYVSASDKIN